MAQAMPLPLPWAKRMKAARPSALLALALFLMCLIFSVNAVKIGLAILPARTLFLLASGGIIFVTQPLTMGQAVRECRRALFVIAAVAILGVTVSYAAGAPMADVFRQILEIHLQAAIGLVVAYALCLLFGPRPVVTMFLIAYAISAVFALGQAIGLDAAWQARAAIGAISGDSPITRIAYETRYRALGLSFSPVLFATQSCLVFAACYCWRLSQEKATKTGLDPAILICLLAVAAMCAVTGNRSPLLGMAAFLFVYILVRNPRLAIIVMPALLMGALFMQPVLDSLAEWGVRVATTGDSSSEGRATLQKYGWFLFGNRPLGYGLTFESTQYWQLFSNEVIYDDNPMSIRNWALHNYYLIILNKYGAFAFAIVPFILPFTRRGWMILLGFIPYIIHIYFHNDGPMQGDFLIFFVIAACIATARQTRPDAPPSPTAKRPWRRAFGQEAAT